MSASHLFYIKRGDLLPSVEAALRTITREPIDLTPATGVRFLCSNGVASPAVIVDTTGGLVRYDWDTDETDTAGVFNAEFEITWGDGRKQTVPNGQNDYIKVIITADLG